MPEQKSKSSNDYIFISKSLFFPMQGILVIGDLHIGYEAMLRQSGVLIPTRQVKEIIEDLKKTFNEIKGKKFNLNKIVFIGDIKHMFSFEKEEKNEFLKVLEFLGDYFAPENIIFIRGNHDTIDYTFEDKMKNYYIDGDLAFTHGHKIYKQIFDKKINTIVMGHLHPAVMLKEKEGVKKEIYKCFLEGKYNGKALIIMPSFPDFAEGTPINELIEDYYDGFSIVPRKSLLDFRVHVVGENEVFDFGKVRDLANF